MLVYGLPQPETLAILEYSVTEIRGFLVGSTEPTDLDKSDNFRPIWIASLCMDELFVINFWLFLFGFYLVFYLVSDPNS